MKDGFFQGLKESVLDSINSFDDQLPFPHVSHTINVGLDYLDKFPSGKGFQTTLVGNEAKQANQYCIPEQVKNYIFDKTKDTAVGNYLFRYRAGNSPKTYHPHDFYVLKDSDQKLELYFVDPERAVKFYAEIFGWKFTKDENLPIDYWRIQTEGANGGLMKRPAKAPTLEQGTNAYVCSVQVEDFDKTSKKILNNGGAVALPKFAVPGKCWQGYFLDTERNTFGLFQVDEKAA